MAVLGLAAFLRFETLGQRPLWGDELEVWRFVHQAEREGFLAASGNPRLPGGKTEADLSPLHALLAYATLALGRSPAWLRAPSALCGVAAVALLMALGARLFDRRTGLCAGLLLAVSVYRINYSQDARAYELLHVLTLAQYGSFFLFLERRGRWPLVFFALAGAASLYAHFLAALNQVVLAGLAALLFALDRRSAARPRARPRLEARDLLGLAGAFGAIFALHLPQLGNLLGYAGSDHVRALWTLDLSPRFLRELVARWGAGPGPAAGLYAAAFAAGVAATLRARTHAAALLVWVASPFVFFALVPFSKFFDIRYLTAGHAPFLLLVAAGLVACADAAGAAVRRLGASPPRASAVGAGALAVLLLALLAPAARGYLEFREMSLRCSDFYRHREVLRMQDGFCRRHVLLNSLLDEDAYLLRRVGARAPRPKAGPRRVP